MGIEASRLFGVVDTLRAAVGLEKSPDCKGKPVQDSRHDPVYTAFDKPRLSLAIRGRAVGETKCSKCKVLISTTGSPHGFSV